METHKAFATCASQYSWNTVIENHSNANEIWSGHGIQACTSVSCFDDLSTKLLRNLGSPLTLKRTRIYALFISNWRTAGTLTFVKPWQFSPPSVMFYCILPYLSLYIKMPHIFPALRRQCKKLKHGTFARLNAGHVRGSGVWLIPTGILYLMGGTSLATES